MGLFTSKEQKEQKELQKQQELAAQQEQKLRAKLAEHHLEGIDAEYARDCAEILTSLKGTGLMEFGNLLSGMKSEDTLKVTYLHALMDQNWIIIRQLDRIAKALEK